MIKHGLSLGKYDVDSRMYINYHALLHLNSVRINLLSLLKRSLISNMMDNFR